MADEKRNLSTKEQALTMNIQKHVDFSDKNYDAEGATAGKNPKNVSDFSSYRRKIQRKILQFEEEFETKHGNVNGSNANNKKLIQ